MESQEQDLRAATANGSGPKAQLECIPGPPAAAPTEDAAPAVDAWLERRLRVFERALSQLETRQEKTERDLIRRIALLEERLASYENAPALSPVMAKTEIASAPAAIIHLPVATPELEAVAEESVSPKKPMGDFLAMRAARPTRPCQPFLIRPRPKARRAGWRGPQWAVPAP